jgi:hypothetical protein
MMTERMSLNNADILSDSLSLLKTLSIVTYSPEREQKR